jgi:hypothetical protein
VPNKTNSDRIADSEKEIVRLSTDFDNLVSRVRTVEDVLREQIKQLNHSIIALESTSTTANLRIATLEKFDPS